MIIENNNNLILGTIIKRIKSEENINYTLYQITSKNLINRTKLLCDNIEKLKKDEENEIIERKNIEYSKLNDIIKEKLLSQNDYMIFKNDNQNIYVLLCQISYNEDIYKEINISQKIEYIANEIVQDFIEIKSKEYNLKLYNE